MGQIMIEQPTEEKLRSMGVESWSTWSAEPSTFDWEYDTDETCFIIEGKAKIKSPEEEVEIKKGDLVTFQKGLKCTWQVLQKINKYYKFG